MFNLNKAKRDARKNVKSDYVVFVITCLLAAYLGSAYTSTLTSFEATKVYDVASTVTKEEYETKSLSADSVLTELIVGDFAKSQSDSEEIEKTATERDVRIGELEISYAKGALSSVVNTLSSGKVLVIIFQTIMSVTKSESVARAIFIVLTAVVVLAATIFIRDTFKVVLSRIFLEGQHYDYVKLSRFLFLFRVRKYKKASITMFVTNLFQLLWDLTIIGGIIKHYSYFMVRYIVAENPDIDTMDAIRLSEKMMDGHKWELCKTEFSFIGWWLLGAVSLGFTRILYSNPYEECTYVSFYEYVRTLAKENNIPTADRLNDIYLYERADEDKLKAAYAHAAEFLSEEEEIKQYMREHAGNWIERKLGVIIRYTKEEEKFNECVEKRDKINEYRHVLAYEQYPGRLFPQPLERRNNRLAHVHYLRRYSIWTVIVMFFVFAFIGWSWEVSLHLVEDGVFVNRGTMTGPWLPIYGSGGVMILLVLYRFRDRPALEASLTIALCGVVEYFTHLYLELMYQTKWWDYSGYFLNIGGRICAEGLLVFMLGGMAIVYALAPLIDNQVRKINPKAVKIVSIILLMCFGFDMYKSVQNPNTGKGITDYGEVEVTQEK